jgi:hypothetical protein
MKMRKKESKGVVKGAPSGLVISLLVHAAAFMLAGLLVVFSVVKKKEISFVPPPAVERPKMKLKKPKVKVKKSAKPASPTRIMAKVNKAVMPDLALPELGGAGTGFGGIGDLGGFDTMPDLGEITLFGGGQSVGNDFVGTFYDCRRTRDGRAYQMEPVQFIDLLAKFVKSGWKKSVLGRYYQSPKKLYATTIAIPPVQSAMAAAAFDEPETGSYSYAILYEGELVYKDDITFRFWGLGDDVLIVRVDGEVVLNAFYPRNGNDFDTERITPSWQSNDSKTRAYWLGIQRSVVGDWITLKAGEPLDMEVLVGEVPGGLFQALLTVEVQGEEYPRNPEGGGPTLPIFKTSELPLDLIENIHGGTNPGDLCVTNGPVFSDFDTSSRIPVTNPPPQPKAVTVDRKSLRTWNNIGGKTIEARYITTIGDQAVMKTAKDKQLKLPLTQLSAADREFIELANPPVFNIEFTKKSTQVPVPELSPYEGNQRPLRIFDFVFGTRLKQTSTGAYNHELTVEYFAVGEEVDGDNYILLDRQESSFVPGGENKGTHGFYGEKTRMMQQALRAAAVMRGTKYGGFLVTVTDKTGEIVQYKASHEFLYENKENLKKIPLGKHFNKDCIRVGPPRLSPDDRPGL